MLIPFNKLKTAHRGLSLLEFVIVFAVLAIILLIVSPKFGQIREKQVLDSAVSDILSGLNKAQSQTLSSLDSSSYGVHFEASQIVIFKGTVYSDVDPNNEYIQLVSPATISDVTLGGISGNSGEMYFDRLSGAPNQAGTVTVATSSLSKTITIYPTGTSSAE